MKNGISPVSLRPGKIPFIRPTYMKISRCMTAFINVAVLRFCFIFWARSKFEFVEKNCRQTFELDQFEEQNKSITYLERQEKAVEISVEWKKERAPEAFFFSEIPSENQHVSEKAWTEVNFKVTKDCSPFQLAGKDLNLRPDEIRRINQIFTWYLLHWEVMFKNWL